METVERLPRVIRLSGDGRITIPEEFRHALGIAEGAELRVSLDGDGLRITPLRPAEERRGSPWLRELYEYFAPVREEIARRGISEEELFADIDAAVEAVRAEQRAKRQ